MGLSKIDLFSSPFNFNIGGSQIQKGTIAGSIFTIIVIALTISYFIYIFQLYLSNQIEPTYRAQSIVNNQTQSIDIFSNIYAINIDYLYPTKQSLQYAVMQIYGSYNNGTDSQQVIITTKKCEDPNLNKDFDCLNQIQYNDNIQKATIQNKNYNYKLTNINFYIISCNDQDIQLQKNCASQQEIDQAINASEITLKMQLSYYDIYLKKVNQSYQTISVLVSSDQFKVSSIKQQNQQTTIKDGFFIQQEQSFTLPFNYNTDNQDLNRQFLKEKIGFGAYSLINLQIDQMYSQIAIQYPTIPQVLALVNSVFSLLIFLGFFMKYISQNSLQEEFFMVLIKNVYQEFYQQIQKKNNLQKSNCFFVSQQTNTVVKNEAHIKQNCQLEVQNTKEKADRQILQDSRNQKLDQHEIIEIQEKIDLNKECQKLFSEQDNKILVRFGQNNQIKINNKEKTNLKNQNGPKLDQYNQIKSKEDNQSQIYSKESLDVKNPCQVSIIINDLNQTKFKENKEQIIQPKQENKQKYIDNLIKKEIFGFRTVSDDEQDNSFLLTELERLLPVSICLILRRFLSNPNLLYPLPYHNPELS
ncbi:hypothetical protein ABPG74_016150 [Tetrahymena malaccensis]